MGILHALVYGTVRHGYVSGPRWAWVATDATNALFYAACFAAPPLVGPAMRLAGRLDDALVTRGVWRVH